jgi:hypothetical protein
MDKRMYQKYGLIAPKGYVLHESRVTISAEDGGAEAGAKGKGVRIRGWERQQGMGSKGEKPRSNYPRNI